MTFSCYFSFCLKKKFHTRNGEERIQSRLHSDWILQMSENHIQKTSKNKKIENFPIIKIKNLSKLNTQYADEGRMLKCVQNSTE